MMPAAPGGRLPPDPPEDICERKMSNEMLTTPRHPEVTVQAGTPMTVTGDGTLSGCGQGAALLLFRSQISRGPGQRPGAGREIGGRA